MKSYDQSVFEPSNAVELTTENLLEPLVSGRQTTALADALTSGLIVGELAGLGGHGVVPLVTYPGQNSASAVRARTVVDLQQSHIGKQVLLAFEDSERVRPIVIGVLRQEETSPRGIGSAVFDIDADGERLVVRATNQLVLVCGEASITLTSAGKVLIRGKYVSSSSSGVNRITGGSVELN